MEHKVYGIGESDGKNWTKLMVKEFGVVIEQGQHIEEGKDRIERVYLSDADLVALVSVIEDERVIEDLKASAVRPVK